MDGFPSSLLYKAQNFQSSFYFLQTRQKTLDNIFFVIQGLTEFKYRKRKPFPSTLFFPSIFSSIGIGHDGAQSCPDRINIMATGTIAGEGSYKWSSCSKNALEQYLRLGHIQSNI